MKTKSLSVFLLLLALPLLAAEPPLIRSALSTNSAVTVPLNLEVPQWNGTAWDFVAMSGGSGAPTTNLIVSLSSTNGYFIYTVTPGGNTNAFFVLTNTPGSTISGTINALIQNYYGLAVDLDTNLFPVGMLAYPYDTGGMRVGDGATLGGLEMSYRTWAGDYLKAPLGDGKAGELAVLSRYTNTFTGKVFSQLWVNSYAGTNWSPVISVHGTNIAANATAFGHGPINPVASFLSIDYGDYGIGADPANRVGVPDYLNLPVVDIAHGNGGDSISGGAGGNGGGFFVPLFSASSGNGGNATANGALGGEGGGFFTPAVSARAGNGGSSAFAGFSGGGGGSSGYIQLDGANGTDATASSDGEAGANGGGILTAASGKYAGGNINTYSPGNRNGGAIETFHDSFAPATKFTTISTAGPTNTVNETSLLGTLASWGDGSALIKSNVIDHAGRTIRFKCSGYINTTLTPTLRVKFKMGSTVLLDTAAVGLVAVTGAQNWIFIGEITFRTVGSSGTCIGESEFNYFNLGGGFQRFGIAPVVTPITINTTIDQTIDITAQFSSAALNSLKCTAAYVEIIN